MSDFVQKQLAGYAANEKLSRGRRFSETPPNNRTQYQRDRDRIVHSAAFRRLEYKTQVFVNHEGDMFRTRLTHTIEVAQIARSVARMLNLNEDLTEAISLAHDLGHTPFGHAGQDVLNNCMKDAGGFEHNMQSLRIIDKLEERYAEFDGLNLTFETREGILKHCSKKNAENLGELGERFLKKMQPGLEAQVANVADEIAYNNHDVDDGLRAGLITIEQLGDVTLFAEQYEVVKSAYPNLPIRRVTHEVIRRMINRQVTDVLDNSKKNMESNNIKTVDDVRNAGSQMIAFGEEMKKQNQELKHFLRVNLYQHYRVHRMTTKAEKVLRSLYEAFTDDNRLLPQAHYEKVSQASATLGQSAAARIVADYIAGMTDRYAIKEYERIYNPVHLT